MFNFRHIHSVNLVTGVPLVVGAEKGSKPCNCCGSALINDLPTWLRPGENRDFYEDPRPPAFHISNLGINFYSGHCKDAEEKKMPFEHIIHQPLGDDVLTIGVVPGKVVVDNHFPHIKWENNNGPLSYSKLEYYKPSNKEQIVNFIYFEQTCDINHGHTQAEYNKIYDYMPKSQIPKVDVVNNKFKQVAALLNNGETLVLILTSNQLPKFKLMMEKYKLHDAVVLHKEGLSNLNYPSSDNPRLSLYILKRN